MENTTRTMRELRSVAQMVKRSFHWIFLMKIQFYHVTWAQKLFFIAIFEKIRSKYIGLNRLNILKLTKENQAFCTCPSLPISELWENHSSIRILISMTRCHKNHCVFQFILVGFTTRDIRFFWDVENPGGPFQFNDKLALSAGFWIRMPTFLCPWN